MSSSGTTPTGFFASLETAFENAFNTVVTDAEQLAVYIGTEVETDLAALWGTLAPLVLTSIQAEAMKTISGEEKFGNAVTNVYETAVGAGSPILIQDAQALVQNGFKWLQDKLAGTVTPPAS